MSAADREAIAALLGRPPQGDFTVVVRHRDGSPVVIENAPLFDDGTPMPTRYWLVGEPERTWIGRLESSGGVDRAEAAVDADKLARAHERYAFERNARIDPLHTGLRPTGGVGGTRTGVKCLHAHFAWWLVGGEDPVGAWIAAQFRAEGLFADVDGPRAPVVAAIDCGTNSTRLLLARADEHGSIQNVERLMRITRLGRGVDATGALDPQAVQRTMDVLNEFHDLMTNTQVVACRITATSAARDATNRDEFFRPVTDLFGVTPELLSGEQEAALSFAGATAELRGDDGSYLVVDIGGGSTEFAVGSTQSGQVHFDAGVSTNIGCVRITERFFLHDPPQQSEIDEARDFCEMVVAGALGSLGNAMAGATLVGLAGTVSALASIDQGLVDYDRSLIHHHILSAARIDELTQKLLILSSTDRLEVPGMEAGRAEVIVGGLIVLGAVMVQTGATSLVVSEADILDGLAASIMPT